MDNRLTNPSPLTVCINCSFFTFKYAGLLPVLSRLLTMFINTTFSTFLRWRPSVILDFKSSKFQLLVWTALYSSIMQYSFQGPDRYILVLYAQFIREANFTCLSYMSPKSFHGHRNFHIGDVSHRTVPTSNICPMQTCMDGAMQPQFWQPLSSSHTMWPWQTPTPGQAFNRQITTKPSLEVATTTLAQRTRQMRHVVKLQR